jgi:hypothetical protein
LVYVRVFEILGKKFRAPFVVLFVYVFSKVRLEIKNERVYEWEHVFV